MLPGHSSTRVTEQNYAPWVRARQEQLEADVKRTRDRDPLAFAAMQGTREVHGKEKAVDQLKTQGSRWRGTLDTFRTFLAHTPEIASALEPA